MATGARRPGSATERRPPELSRTPSNASVASSKQSKGLVSTVGSDSRPGSAVKGRRALGAASQASKNSVPPTPGSTKSGGPLPRFFTLKDQRAAKLTPLSSSLKGRVAEAWGEGSPIDEEDRDDFVVLEDEAEEVFGWTKLMKAAHTGELQWVRRVLDSKADALAACKVGNTALHLAARSGHLKVLSLLVARAARLLNAQNKNGWTALIWTAISGHTECAAVLVEAKANTSKVDEEGLTAFLWAAKHGRLAIVKLLLTAGCEFDARDDHGRDAYELAKEYAEMRSLLMATEKMQAELLTAAQRNDQEAVQAALVAGANVNHLDAKGFSALVWAALHGSLDLVRLLCQHGASTAAIEDAGLRLETLGDSHREVASLVAAASVANERLMAAARDSNWDGVQKALGSCAKVDYQSLPLLRTAFIWAGFHGAAHAVMLLARARADHNKRDSVGFTALHYAVAGSSVETVCTLVHIGCNLYLRTYEGELPIEHAVRSDNPSMVQLLLAGACDIETRDSTGATLSQIAAARGHAVALRALLLYHADVRIRDERGVGLCSLAAAQGHGSVLQVLVSTPKPLGPMPEEALLDKPLDKMFLASKAPGPLEVDLDEEDDDGAGSTATSASTSKPPSVAASTASRDRRDPVGSKMSSTSRGVPRVADLQRRAMGGLSHSALAKNALSVPARKQKPVPVGVPGRVGGPPQESLELSPLEVKAAGHLLLLAKARKMRQAWEKFVPPPLGSVLLSEKDDLGRTALMQAVRQGHAGVVHLLVQMKSQVEAEDVEGNTALFSAAEMGRSDLVSTLLESGARVTHKNEDGRSPLDVAANSGVYKLLQTDLVRRVANLPAKSEKVLTTQVKLQPVETSKTPSVVHHRVRLEGLPTTLPADLMEGHIRSLLRRMGSSQPEVVEVVQHPIHGRVQRAYVEFEEESKVKQLVSGRGDKLCGTSVRFYRAEPKLVPD